MSDQVWITDQRFRILDTVFRILTQDHGLAAWVARLLHDFESTSRPARSAHIVQITGGADEPCVLHRGCYRQASGNSAADVLPDLIGLINQAAIGEVRHFAAHASVVARGDRVVAFPARSGGGKTTLAAASLLSGFSYVSDEALILNDSGLVVPYPKPLALSRWSCQALGLSNAGEETLFTPADLGSSVVSSNVQLTDLVISQYGDGEPSIASIPSSEAVSQLISNSFNHYKDPERAFRISTDVARKTRVWRLDYRDPSDALRNLEKTLA